MEILDSACTSTSATRFENLALFVLNHVCHIGFTPSFPICLFPLYGFTTVAKEYQCNISGY